MFLGTHRPRLDEKGRLALPAKFREELGEGVVLTKGQDRCLYGYTSDAFTRISDALRDAPVGSQALRNYQRTFFGSASLEVPDKQGRVTLPGSLRAYAGLDRDCVVVGTNARFEILECRCLRRVGGRQRREVRRAPGGGAARSAVNVHGSRSADSPSRTARFRPARIPAHLPRCLAASGPGPDRMLVRPPARHSSLETVTANAERFRGRARS